MTEDTQRAEALVNIAFANLMARWRPKPQMDQGEWRALFAEPEAAIRDAVRREERERYAALVVALDPYLRHQFTCVTSSGFNRLFDRCEHPGCGHDREWHDYIKRRGGIDHEFEFSAADCSCGLMSTLAAIREAVQE